MPLILQVEHRGFLRSDAGKATLTMPVARFTGYPAGDLRRIRAALASPPPCNVAAGSQAVKEECQA